MNSDQFARALRREGIVIERKKGTGHKALTNPKNGMRSELPTHGGAKQLPKGLMIAIRKQLGLK